MRFVLITGISSGIGLFLAHLLTKEGFFVIGTLRYDKVPDPELLKQTNFAAITMDLHEDVSIEAGVEQLKSILRENPLYALINNAGYAVPGPLTHLPMAHLKAQFQVNVFGSIRLIQLILPFLKSDNTKARILNISSISGLFASPFLGAYAGSKFALEGLSDSLRRELTLFGIKVILIEPGPIKTLIWQKNLRVEEDFKLSPYALYLTKATKTILETERNALPVESLKDPILAALNSKNPKNRYLIHKNKILFLLLAKFLPSKWVDFLVRRNLTSENSKIRPV
ncbi:MAG: SDR family oxidoreductase [Saprospiraceae bacterium]|nr:SDR family oxidoreductase [Saprospiraceae bacterium]